MSGPVFRVTDVQRFTTRDGPGLRTTVFFKGCSLRCQWCHNPEAIDAVPALCFHERRCVRCGGCAAVCPRGRFPEGRGAYVFDADCAGCGACARACPAEAIAWDSREMTLEEIRAAALRDRAFYRPGGVTLSGGEPLLRPELPALLAALREEKVHTAVDTALNVPWERVAAAMPHTSLFLADVKAMDPVLHRALTGAGNARILENIARLAREGARMWIRVPVIPERNAGELAAIADFVRGLGRRDIPVELIPYHDMAAGKYASLGREMPLRELRPPSAEMMDEYRGIFADVAQVCYN